MEWNLFTFEDIIQQPKQEKLNNSKKYTQQEYRDYIAKHFKADYNNKTFYNIIISKYFSYLDDFMFSLEPKEQLAYFKKLYNSFTYHLQTNEITIFSMKYEYDNAPAEYDIFALINNDFIVEFPSVIDLFNDKISMPACAIDWYNADGTRADMNKYLNLTNEEKNTWIDFVNNQHEIIPPKDDKNWSHSEWWKDRREYYFFSKLKIHKYGKPGRVFDKHTYDTFADYTFTLMDMFKYFHDRDTTQE